MLCQWLTANLAHTGAQSLSHKMSTNCKMSTQKYHTCVPCESGSNKPTLYAFQELYFFCQSNKFGVWLNCKTIWLQDPSFLLLFQTQTDLQSNSPLQVISFMHGRPSWYVMAFNMFLTSNKSSTDQQSNLFMLVTFLCIFVFPLLPPHS